MIWWLLVPAAYLLGSISPAWLAGRVNGIDLRQHGSGSLGATNAGRVLGRRWFAIVFTADVLKGALPTLAAAHLPQRFGASDPFMQSLLVIAVAAAAVLGHIFTCFHGFKGGKAVATALGMLIAMLPLVAAGAFAVWLVVWLAGWAVFTAKKSDAVGPASVAAAFAAPPLHVVLSPAPWSHDGLPATLFITAVALLVVVKHRSNIRKLFARTA